MILRQVIDSRLADWKLQSCVWFLQAWTIGAYPQPECDWKPLHFVLWRRCRGGVEPLRPRGVLRRLCTTAGHVSHVQGIDRAQRSTVKRCCRNLTASIFITKVFLEYFQKSRIYFKRVNTVNVEMSLFSWGAPQLEALIGSKKGIKHWNQCRKYCKLFCRHHIVPTEIFVQLWL